MRALISVILGLAMSASAQQQPATPAAQSSGACSPNILSNQGKVEFTCNTSIDAATATKIVSLLNQILQKEGAARKPIDEVNIKLDEILAFLRSQAQQSQKMAAGIERIQQQIQERHLSEYQKFMFASILKSYAPKEFYFLCAPDAETTHFADEVLDVMESAGWRAVPHPPNWGIMERQGIGVQLLVQDVTKPVCREAIVLQQALRAIGIEAPGSNFIMAPNEKVTLYVGLRPSQ